MSENIHERIKSGVELATSYAEDGAFHSAAVTLERLAGAIRTHAVVVDAAMDAESGRRLSRRMRAGR